VKLLSVLTSSRKRMEKKKAQKFRAPEAALCRVEVLSRSGDGKETLSTAGGATRGGEK